MEECERSVIMDQSLSYIEALNRETGLDIRLSPSGAAHFVLEDRGILLQWLEPRQMFAVYAEVGPLAGWRDDEVLRRLMSANFLFMQTGGGALSYDPAANMVGMNYALPVYGLSPEEFVRKLDAVVTLAEEWRDQLRRMCAEQERLVTQNVAYAAESPTDAESLAAMQNMMRV